MEISNLKFKVKEILDILKGIDFGSVIMYFYLLALVRQIMWLIPDNIIAWTCTIPLTLIGWVIFLKYYSEFKEERKMKLSFILMVIIPITILFLIRVSFPDTSFDVMSYHLFESQRSLIGPILAKSDFAYYVTPNSLPDMILGIFRFLLGYRLGTIGNLFAIIWMAIELERLLSKFIKGSQLINLSVFAIILCENIFYEINTYLIDLLALPLLVHLVYALLDRKNIEKSRTKLFYMSFIAGLVIALKLTNVIFVIPIMSVELYSYYRQIRKVKFLDIFLMAFVVSISLIPFHVFMWIKTGNPVFPFYNGIFHSPYGESVNFNDPRWGPKSNSEKILWPFIATFMRTRISEFSHYSGRLLLGTLVIPLVLFTKKKYNAIIPLTVIFIFSAVLWSITTGYIRYAIYLDILGGLIFVLTIETLYTFYSRKILGIITIIILILGLQVQLLCALEYSLLNNWSMNPTVFGNQSRFKDESRYLLHDYKLTTFLSENNQDIIQGVEVWLDTNILTRGIEMELKPNIPLAIINGYHPANNDLEKFLSQNSNRNMYTICRPGEFADVQKLLKTDNLKVESVRNLMIPYYSTYTKIDTLLIKVSVEHSTNQQYHYGEALPEAADKEKINEFTPIPKVVTRSQTLKLSFKIKNESNIPWPMAGDKPVHIGDKWLDEKGNVIINEDGRGSLSEDLEQGKEQIVNFDITAPKVPGNYILQTDMVQEGVRWFGSVEALPFQKEIIVQ